MGVHDVPFWGHSVPPGAMRLLERASFARNSRVVTAMAPHGPAWAPAQLAGFRIVFREFRVKLARNSCEFRP